MRWVLGGGVGSGYSSAKTKLRGRSQLHPCIIGFLYTWYIIFLREHVNLVCVEFGFWASGVLVARGVAFYFYPSYLLIKHLHSDT